MNETAMAWIWVICLMLNTLFAAGNFYLGNYIFAAASTSVAIYQLTGWNAVMEVLKK